MKNERNYYVYEYVRLDYNTPFYIGKGKNDRWRSNKSRNKYFQAIQKSTDVAVIIVADGLTSAEASEIEAWYIWQLRDVQGYWLANMTDGGDGGNTLSGMSAERKKQYRKDMSIKLMGREFSESHRRKIGDALRGRIISEETRKRISKARTGHKHSEEHIKLLREMFSGEKNPMYGRKHSEETKKLIGKKNTKPIVVKDSSGQVVIRFESSHDLLYSDWRKSFPPLNGINYLRECLTKGRLFHGLSVLYDKEEEKTA